MADYLVQEDGVSKILLEDGSGALLLETSGGGEVDPSFIGSVTTVYSLSLDVNVISVPFITAGRTRSFPISEDFLGNAAEFENGLGQGYDDFTLADDALVANVYPPVLQSSQLAAPFIASRTVVYGPLVDDAYAVEVRASSPAFYWRLGDPVGSTTVADSSGDGHTGTVHGSVTLGQPSLLTAITDTSAKFGGTDADWIEGGDWDIVGSDITVECWVEPNTTFPAGGCHLVAKHSGVSDVQGSIGIDAAGHFGAEFTIGGVYYHVVARTVMQPGVKYHVAATYDGSFIRCYVNGVEDCDPVAATGSLANNSWEWSVGGLHGGVPNVINPWNGWIDEVAVYPSALSDAELWKHYELGVGLHGAIGLTFIASKTVAYAPFLGIELPFIVAGQVFDLAISRVDPPFIASKTHVWDIFTLFDPNKTYAGPGNGGESFLIRLAPNGTTVTATLAADITAESTLITLTGDGSLPATEPFVVTIGSEVIYLVRVSPGTYRVRGRGMSNTTPAVHTAGATVSWGDTYDMPIVATSPIAGSFTDNINSTGSYTYPGWLVAFDSTQAYLSGSRYPMHVSKLLGVFAAGAGSSGANKCDAAQPSAIASPTGISDHAPAGLTNPSRIQTDINVGDVALLRYTNPEATALDLGPRSTAIQSWFGLKRVDATDNDVTFTDPNGIVVDTTGGELTYTGAINAEYAEPLPLQIGVAPDASDAAGFAIDTPSPVPWETVTLPGTDRFFTYGPPHYSEKGWPFGVITVRQGNRRIPHWQSWDWHNYSYVFTGFGTDDTFAQIVINRNGIVFGSVPVVELPGPQDIPGPDAVWDDASYYYAVCWYVAIFAGPYIVAGPPIGGSPPPPGSPGPPTPIVGWTPGPGGGPSGPPIVTVPPIEGGSGGGVDGNPVNDQLFQAAAV